MIPINARKRDGIDDLKEAILNIKSPRKKILDTREVFPEIIDKVNKIQQGDDLLPTVMKLSLIHI